MRLILFALITGSVGAQQSPKASDTSITLPPELDRVLRDYEAGWKPGHNLDSYRPICTNSSAKLAGVPNTFFDILRPLSQECTGSNAFTRLQRKGMLWTTTRERDGTVL